MANRTVPKVETDRDAFENLLDRLALSYNDLEDVPSINRTGQTIRKNVRNGEMPLHTVIAIAEYLHVQVSTFAPGAITDKDIARFLRLLSKEQKRKMLILLLADSSLMAPSKVKNDGGH